MTRECNGRLNCKCSRCHWQLVNVCAFIVSFMVYLVVWAIITYYVASRTIDDDGQWRGAEGKWAAMFFAVGFRDLRGFAYIANDEQGARGAFNVDVGVDPTEGGPRRTFTAVLVAAWHDVGRQVAREADTTAAGRAGEHREPPTPAGVRSTSGAVKTSHGKPWDKAAPGRFLGGSRLDELFKTDPQAERLNRVLAGQFGQLPLRGRWWPPPVPERCSAVTWLPNRSRKLCQICRVRKPASRQYCVLCQRLAGPCCWSEAGCCVLCDEHCVNLWSATRGKSSWHGRGGPHVWALLA
jgi:hypothetical protein